MFSTLPVTCNTLRFTDAGEPDVLQLLRQANKVRQDEQKDPVTKSRRGVERSADSPELLSRTVHVRFLPTGMKQCELAALCADCGTYTRIRICGNSQSPSQNWIYGFIEFTTPAAASKMLRKTGLMLANGGKGFLRLKCNAAKQPIVDRVFHDADVPKGVPCTFGTGSFANRTLKEALDSYFSLVSKATSATVIQSHQDPKRDSGSDSDSNTPSVFVKPTLHSESATSSLNGLTPLLSPKMPVPVHGAPKATATSFGLMQRCYALLDSAMHSGQSFVSTQRQTSFFDAVKSLDSLNELLASESGTMVPPPALREVRVSAAVIAAALHILRGTLPDVLTQINSVMSQVSQASLEAVDSPQEICLPPGAHDDDEEFLSALSRVHVSDVHDHTALSDGGAAYRHNIFLINSLIALGMIVERSSTLIARCLYAMAQCRAQTTIGARHPKLDDTLKQGGCHRLFDDVFGAAGGATDSTLPAADFFRTYGARSAAASDAAAVPLHFVSLIPTSKKSSAE